MAYINQNNFTQSFKLGTSIAATTGSQFRAVYLSTDNTVDLPVASSSTIGAFVPIGICATYQSTGSGTVNVVLHGITKGIAGSGIAAGSRVVALTNGSLSSITAACFTTTCVSVGIALEAASTGSYFTVLVCPEYVTA